MWNFYLNFSSKYSKISTGVAKQYGDGRNRFQGRFHGSQKSSTSASKWTTATNKCAARQKSLLYHLPVPIEFRLRQCNSISALTIKPWLGAEGLFLVSDLTVLSRPLFWYVGLHVQCIHYVWQMTSWMKTFPALLALCAENSPFTGEFPTQRPVTRRFNVFFDLRRNKRLSTQSWSWWFETSLWRHCNEVFMLFSHHFGIFVAGWERNLDNPDFIDVGKLYDICYRLTGCRIFYKNSKFVARIY